MPPEAAGRAARASPSWRSATRCRRSRRWSRARRASRVTDYRDVLRALKKEQIVGDAILPHYQARLQATRGDHPARADRHAARRARRRSGWPARRRARPQPAPNMRPPRLIGNTGETGDVRAAAARAHRRRRRQAAMQGYDDFTFDAASWTLTAHEARPGHELQFAAHRREGRVARARRLRLQQRQRRGLGALHGGGDEAVHAARRPARRAAAPPAARGARVPRSRSCSWARSQPEEARARS